MSSPRAKILRPILNLSQSALLCASIWLCATQVQAQTLLDTHQPPRAVSASAPRLQKPSPSSADQPFQIAAKGGNGPLDVGDERPIGDLGIMRGKKNEFAYRNYGSKPNHWLDLAIILDAVALLTLIVYVIASRR